MPTMKTKIWLSLAAIFAAGALAVNALWVHYYNVIDARHVQQIDELTDRYANRIAGLERTHKRAMGEMRNRVERKVDRVLEKLDKLPSKPIIIETRSELEEVKND